MNRAHIHLPQTQGFICVGDDHHGTTLIGIHGAGGFFISLSGITAEQCDEIAAAFRASAERTRNQAQPVEG